MTEKKKLNAERKTKEIDLHDAIASLNAQKQTLETHIKNLENIIQTHEANAEANQQTYDILLEAHDKLAADLQEARHLVEGLKLTLNLERESKRSILLATQIATGHHDKLQIDVK